MGKSKRKILDSFSVPSIWYQTHLTGFILDYIRSLDNWHAVDIFFLPRGLNIRCLSKFKRFVFPLEEDILGYNLKILNVSQKVMLGSSELWHPDTQIPKGNFTETKGIKTKSFENLSSSCFSKTGPELTRQKLKVVVIVTSKWLLKVPYSANCGW